MDAHTAMCRARPYGHGFRRFAIKPLSGVLTKGFNPLAERCRAA